MSARRASAAAACAAAAAVALPTAVAAASPSATAPPASSPHLAPPPHGAPTQLPGPLAGLELKQAHVIFRCVALLRRKHARDVWGSRAAPRLAAATARVRR